MKIRTQETAEYFEEWSYEIDSLPEGFDEMSPRERFDWLLYNCISTHKISSDPADIGIVEEYEIEA